MTFEYADEQYRIVFKHGKFELPTDPSVTVRGTWCRVAKVNLYIGLVGYSYCHPNDNFCRETGRKLALKKALLKMSSQPFRTAAWRAYLRRPRGLHKEG